MNRTIRTSVLIVMAMLGSAVVLAGLVRLTTDLTIYAKTPADFLPGDSTVALLHHPTSEDMRIWSAMFPELNELPAASYDAVGIVKTDRTYGAIGFTMSDRPTANSIGPFRITVTDEQLRDTLQSDLPVRKTNAYPILAKEYVGKSTWTYLTVPAPNTNTLSEHIARTVLTGDSQAVGITAQSDNLVVTSVDTRKGRLQRLQQVTESKDTVLSIRFADAAASWNGLTNALPTEKSHVMEGLLRNTLTSYGTHLSLEHDLFALLREPGFLQVTATGSQIGILLGGQHPNEKVLHTILDRFHSEYLGTLPATKVTKRVLDSRFSSVDIRHDQSMIDDWHENTDGWLLRGIRHSEKRNGMFSAVRGKRFLLSTNETLLRAAIHAPDETDDLSDGNILTDTALFGNKSEAALGALFIPNLLPAPWVTKPLKIRTVLGNNVRHVRMEGLQAPLNVLDSLR